MAKPNYQYEKRQRDLAKKQKQEEKRRQKLANKAAEEQGESGGQAEGADADTPAAADSSNPGT